MVCSSSESAAYTRLAAAMPACGPCPHQYMSAGVVGTSPGRMSLSGLLWARALYSRFFGCSRPCMP